MAKRVIERSEVFDAARRLEEQGVECNAHQIWNALGKRGSFTTIKNDLDAYFESDDREPLLTGAQAFDMDDLDSSDMPVTVKRELARLAQSLQNIHHQTRKEVEAEFTPSLNLLLTKNTALQLEAEEVNKVAEFSTEQVDVLTEQVATLTDKLQSVSEEKVVLEQAHDRATSDLADLEKEWEKLMIESGSLRTENDNLTHAKSELEQSLSSLTTEKGRLDNIIAALEKELFDAKSLIDDLQYSVSDKNQKLKELGSMVATQREQIVTLDKEVTESRDTLSELKNEAGVLQFRNNEYERQQVILTQKNAELAQSLSSSQGALAAVTAQRDDAVAKLPLLEADNKELSINVGKHEERASDLAKRVNELALIPSPGQLLSCLSRAGLLSLNQQTLESALAKLNEVMMDEELDAAEQPKLASRVSRILTKGE